MTLSREDILQNNKALHQEAIVKKLIKGSRTKPIIHKIPNGKQLHLSLQNDKEIRSALYNWLRRCKNFSQVTLSFAKDLREVDTEEVKVYDFPRNTGKHFIWETHEDGRRFLADQMTNVLMEERPVAIIVKADGIYVEKTRGDESFRPTRKVTQEDMAAQQQIVIELSAELEAEGKTLADIGFVPFELNQEIASERWEPHLVFIPSLAN